jgi:hypothetical protein
MSVDHEPEYGRVALDALRDEAVQDSIGKGIQPPDQFFRDLEMDLSDWSLAYGAAWATARECRPQLSGSDLALVAHAPALGIPLRSSRDDELPWVRARDEPAARCAEAPR